VNNCELHSVEPVVAYLALGSNLGDRAGTIQSAIGQLAAVPGIEVLKVSSVHETEPIGLPGQNRYMNAAVMVRTCLPPRELLRRCLEVEMAHGRRRIDHERWGPRTLDIDVLLYGNQVIYDLGPPRLRVPHPRMAQRLFVLNPLAEIAGDVIHPTLKASMRTLGDALRAAEYQSRSLCSQ